MKVMSVVLLVGEDLPDAQFRRDQNAAATVGFTAIDPPLDRHALLHRELVRPVVETDDLHADALRLLRRARAQPAPISGRNGSGRWRALSTDAGEHEPILNIQECPAG